MLTSASFALETASGVVVGEVRGAIDMATAPGLQRELIASVPSSVHGLVLDLSRAPYVDSAGIRLLFTLASALQTRRQQLLLVVPEQAPIRAVLVLVGMAAAAALHPDIDTALESFETGAAQVL